MLSLSFNILSNVEQLFETPCNESNKTTKIEVTYTSFIENLEFEPVLRVS